MKESELLETEHIPRVLFSRIEPFRETNLHVFFNARQDAFGVCAYLRQEFEDNVVECRLVAGKGRVAPLKEQSVCRLNLWPVMGALNAASLAEKLALELMTKIEKITF